MASRQRWQRLRAGVAMALVAASAGILAPTTGPAVQAAPVSPVSPQGTTTTKTSCPSAFSESNPSLPPAYFPMPPASPSPTSKLINCTGGAYVAPQGNYFNKHTTAKFGNTGLVNDGCSTITKLTIKITGTPGSAGFINMPFNNSTNARLPLADTTYGTLYGSRLAWSVRAGFGGYTADPSRYPTGNFVATAASGEISLDLDIDPTAISLADLVAGKLSLASYVVGWGATGSGMYDEIKEITLTVTVDNSNCGVEVRAQAVSSVYGQPFATVAYNTKNLGGLESLPTGDWFVNPVVCKAYTDNTFTTELPATALPGTYPIHCTGDTTSGLGTKIQYFDSTYTVSKIPLTITPKAKSKVYGDVATFSTATDWDLTSGSLRPGDSITSVTINSTGAPASAAVGSYSIGSGGAIGTGLSVYQITYRPGTLTVSKAPLTVTADPVTVSQGDPPPTPYTITYSGWKNGETQATPPYLWIAPSCTSSYSSTTLATDPPPAITCSGGRAFNYSFVFVPNTVTVTPSNVMVEADDASSEYDGNPISLAATPYTVSSLGTHTLPTDISCGIFEADGTTEVTGVPKPGTYRIICTGSATTTDTGTEIAVNYVEGVYTVTKPKLSITAADRSKTYGDTISTGDNTNATIAGLKGTDAVTVTFDLEGGEAATKTVGEYIIAPTATLSGSRTLDDYYDVTYVDGALVINPATLTVTAKSYSLDFAAAAPAYDVKTITGWKNGEAATDPVDGWTAPTCTSLYDPSMNIGTSVTSTCSGGAATNYVFEYVDGDVSVGASEQGVTNTTVPRWTSTGATTTVTLAATITSWKPGCLVTWNLSPDTRGGPYTAFLIGSDDISLDAQLPPGVYTVDVTLSGNCEEDDASTNSSSGVVAVVPDDAVGRPHVDGAGSYIDPTTSKKVKYDFHWEYDSYGRFKGRIQGWEVFPGPGCRVNCSYSEWRVYQTISDRLTASDGNDSSATVSTWGRIDCPGTLGYPATAAPICSQITVKVRLQSRANKYAPWVDTGNDYLMVFLLAEGQWPYGCRTTQCKYTTLYDHLSVDLRPLSPATSLPAGVPGFTPWQRVGTSGIQHLKL